MQQNELFQKTSAPLGDGWKVKILGLGGVGSIVAPNLFKYLRSLGTDGRLTLVDGDDFEPENASRMLFATYGNKASVVCDELRPHARDSRVALVACEEFVETENLSRLIGEDEIIILAVDNHATRKLVSDYCAKERKNVCLISGGNDGVEEDAGGRTLRGTFGSVQIFLRKNGRDASPALGAFHPEIADPADRLPSEPSCAELMASVPQILFTNVTTAAAIMNAFWLYVSGKLGYSELCFDIQDGLMRPAPLPPPELE